MSRVLRRPMFRGGIADSEGTGITSGLMDNYNQGGRVGLKKGKGVFDFISPEVVTEEEIKNRSDIYPYEKRNVEELINLFPIGRLGTGLNILKSAGKYPTVKDIYGRYQTTKPDFISGPKGTSPYQPPAFGTNAAIREAIAPYLSGAKEITKTGLKKAKDYALSLGLTGGTGYALYDALQDDEKKQEETNVVDTNKKNIDPTVQALIDENKKLQELIYSGGGQETTRADDVKSVVEDLLPIFKEQLGVSEDEYSRQKYLELAKFGLNLLRQPAGPPGGKKDLLGAIAAAGEKPLEGYASIVEKERQAQKLPRALALETAIKLSEPGTMAKNINDLMKTGEFKSKAEAIAFLGKEGSAAARNLQERVISEYGVKIAEDFDMKSTAATQVARKLFPYRDKINIAEFKPFPSKKEERIVGGKYIDKESGRFGIYNGTGLIEPGDPGYIF
jgi:hypothetical protein